MMRRVLCFTCCLCSWRPQKLVVEGRGSKEWVSEHVVARTVQQNGVMNKSYIPCVLDACGSFCVAINTVLEK